MELVSEVVVESVSEAVVESVSEDVVESASVVVVESVLEADVPVHEIVKNGLWSVSGPE